MPVEGLEKVTPEIAGNIARKMQMLNAQDEWRLVSLGTETSRKIDQLFSKDARQVDQTESFRSGVILVFLEKWRLVTSAVRSVAPKTLMLWAPNSGFGKGNDALLGGYARYWPGDEWVDMIGLSFYHYGGLERVNVLPAPTEAQDTIKEFAKLYGSKNHDRPVVLAETAAAYTRSLDGRPAPGTANERDIKLAWMSQLLSRSMAEAVPELKAIVWLGKPKRSTHLGKKHMGMM
ncbi:hypothetical protein KEM48_008066 [Puccinia striiformis f. sp. tritici PST-130]|nr:hypothetical protein KEM48_008066 [Puccinia striiformis f. sp. tritici PST-130]